MFSLKRGGAKSALCTLAAYINCDVPDNGGRGKAFLAHFETLVRARKRERSRLEAYRQHLECHMAPFPVARHKLSTLNGPKYAEFCARSGARAFRSDGATRLLDVSPNNRLRSRERMDQHQPGAQRSPRSSVPARTLAECQMLTKTHSATASTWLLHILRARVQSVGGLGGEGSSARLPPRILF